MSARLRLTPRSNGVRVRRSTAFHVTAGNIARSQQNWSSAARSYQQAVTREPHLQHLWVQLGHMEKEAGQIDQAITAYEYAAHLQSDDPEPLLHLGHIAKAWRQPVEAARYFVTALQRDRNNLEAVSELARLLPDRDSVEPRLWSAVLEVLKIDPSDYSGDDIANLPAAAIVFDVTDLLAFFGQRRLPTGIQRVQIEVSLGCLAQPLNPPPTFCVYASVRRGWVRLPHDLFDSLCRLAKQSDDVNDPAWISQLDQIYRQIAVARTIRFAPGTLLVNLGTSWSDRNYLLDVRIVRARDGVVYVPLVFDLIPLIGPRWFLQSLVRDYRAWFGSLLHSADGFLAISNATRDDLLRVSAEWGSPVPAEAVAVVRLEGDFRQAAAASASLHAYGLEPGRYVLLVSTLEPRKNHRAAFEAWLMLAKTLDATELPRLVCVGGRGWLNESLHQMLRENPALQRMVLILHGIPDDVLAALYEHCLFALYPSHYEGWGLPVSEALSYGKVPAISRVSSLPEAGGRFARYFDPGNVADIAATVRSLLDEPTRRGAEAAIRADYAPRLWHEIARDLVDKARNITARGHSTLPILADVGVWTLALPHRPDEADLTSTAVLQGEALRYGRAWQSLGISGCRIDGEDAALWFRWAGPKQAILHIHCAPGRDPGAVGVRIDGSEQTAHLLPDLPKIVSCPLPDTPAIVRISIIPSIGEIIVEAVEISLSDTTFDRIARS